MGIKLRNIEEKNMQKTAKKIAKKLRTKTGQKCKENGEKLKKVKLRFMKAKKNLAKKLENAIALNDVPMQILGPSPKGRYEYGTILCLFSSEKRSGSNVSGSGNNSGS